MLFRNVSTAGVSVYRVYMLDEYGRIFCSEDVEALDDEDAIAAGWIVLYSHADQPAAAYGFEIWSGRNLIFCAGPERSQYPSDPADPDLNAVGDADDQKLRLLCPVGA